MFDRGNEGIIKKKNKPDYGGIIAIKKGRATNVFQLFSNQVLFYIRTQILLYCCVRLRHMYVQQRQQQYTYIIYVFSIEGTDYTIYTCIL